MCRSAFCYSQWFWINLGCDGELKKHQLIIPVRAGNPEGIVVHSTSSLWWFVFCLFFLVILVLYQNMSPVLWTWRSSNENSTNLDGTYYFLNQVDGTNPILLCSFQRKHVSKAVLCLAFVFWYSFCGGSQKNNMWHKWITNMSDLCVNVSGTVYEARSWKHESCGIWWQSAVAGLVLYEKDYNSFFLTTV